MLQTCGFLKKPEKCFAWTLSPRIESENFSQTTINTHVNLRAWFREMDVRSGQGGGRCGKRTAISSYFLDLLQKHWFSSWLPATAFASIMVAKESQGSSSGQVVFCPGLGTLGASLFEMKL